MLARVIKLVLDPLLMRDGAAYLVLAEHWFATGNYVETFLDGIVVPPLPLLTIKEGMELGFSAEIIGRSISILLGTLIPVFGYCLSLRIQKKGHTALAVALILMLHPTLIEYSIQPLRENYYLVFCEIAVLLAIDGIKRGRIREWLSTGTVLGLAYSCRYESLELAILLPLILLCGTNRKGTMIKKLTLIFFFGFIATTVFILSMIDFNLSYISKIMFYVQNFGQSLNKCLIF